MHSGNKQQAVKGEGFSQEKKKLGEKKLKKKLKKNLKKKTEKKNLKIFFLEKKLTFDLYI